MRALMAATAPAAIARSSSLCSGVLDDAPLHQPPPGDAEHLLGGWTQPILRAVCSMPYLRALSGPASVQSHPNPQS